MTRCRTPKVESPPPGRADVPAHPDDAASRISLAAKFDRLADELRARNLHNAVLLAQQAACGHGPLVDHFCELGRVWGWRLLDGPPPVKERRRKMTVIEGGRS